MKRSTQNIREESFGSYQTYATETPSFMHPSQILYQSNIFSRQANPSSRNSRHRPAERAVSQCNGEQASFQRIETILTEENQNLKEQNNFLKAQVARLKNYASLYKERFEEARAKLGVKELECETQREKSKQLKKIITSHLVLMEQKMLKEESTHEEEDNLLLALNLSQILPK